MNLEGRTKVILEVVRGPEQGKTFEFTEQDNFLLGRDVPGSKAHFRLSPKDIYVSRNQFLMEINPPDCYLRDTGSLNGTFIVREIIHTGSTSRILFSLKGRGETNWIRRANDLSQQFQCASYQEVGDRVKLENGDLINVGETIIEVKIANDTMPLPQENDGKKGFICIRCRKEIEVLTAWIEPTEAKKLTTEDFLCKECRAKESRDRELSTEEEVKCWTCHQNLTSIANTGGRAVELRNIALYCCERCACSMQGKVPISRIGGYRLLRELGSGGFGVVYVAWHEATTRIVALKLTKERIKRNKQLLERFKREIRIMKELRHPHLVRLYDEGISDEESYYFVSEYLPEGSLADEFRGKYNGKIPYGQACYYISQALDGLSYFHNFKEKYVHRDLKPENIFLRKDEKGRYVAKIGDFGLAKSYILHGGTITREGEWAGTIFYCPPEQIIAFKDAKPSTDVYAMGMTLYRLITGEFPYHFPSRREQFEMISKGNKPRDPVDIILGKDKPTSIQRKAPDIPNNLAEALNKAIEKDASKRFQSAEEFRQVVERYSICM